MEIKHRLNIILTFAIPLILIFVGLIVSFLLLNAYFTFERLMSWHPACLGCFPPDPALVYMAMQTYGLTGPLFSRVLRYVGDFLSCSWGQSFYVSSGTPITEFLRRTVPHTIELLILPLCLGIALGYLIGKVSNRTSRKWLKTGIQLLSSGGVAIPIFFFAAFLQYTLGYLVPLFPATGYISSTNPNPPLITGFLIFDALISGNMYLVIDILYHYVLPSIVLTVAITALMTKLFSSQMVKDSYKKKTILSNTAKTVVAFGAIFIYLILIDVTFDLGGFGYFFIVALTHFDFFLIRGFLFMFLILFATTLFISNLVFSLNRLIKDRKLPQEEIEKFIDGEPNLSPKVEIKNYLNKVIRSPLVIVGFVAVLFPIFISIFPELVSGYTLEEIIDGSSNWFGPPSPENPLGTTYNGRDVLALISYGTRDVLIFGSGAVLVGLIGGLIFGLLASKFNRKVHLITMSIMFIFYVLPAILLVMLLASIFTTQNYIYKFGDLMFVSGLLLVPSFTRIIANTEFRIVSIGKKVISYMPLFTGYIIILYIALGYLEFFDPLRISLGDFLNYVTTQVNDAPWASFWPGLTAFLIVISLFTLHEGLVQHSR